MWSPVGTTRPARVQKFYFSQFICENGLAEQNVSLLQTCLPESLFMDSSKCSNEIRFNKENARMQVGPGTVETADKSTTRQRTHKSKTHREDSGDWTQVET